jgi:hypothetical protein
VPLHLHNPVPVPVRNLQPWLDVPAHFPFPVPLQGPPSESARSLKRRRPIPKVSEQSKSISFRQKPRERPASGRRVTPVPTVK